MRKLFACIISLCLSIVFSGCFTAGKISRHQVSKLFKQSKTVNDHFTGFALYDMDSKQMIFELNSDKYFTPASNTKLLTFYTCLKMLGDTIPSLRYVERGGSLIFWGTGDPSLLHTDVKGSKAYAFLKSTGKKLLYAETPLNDAFYGAGWAWDDYNDYYQAEINDLPLEDNLAQISVGADGKLKINPAYFNGQLVCDSSFKPASFRVKRNLLNNTFIYPAMPIPAGFTQWVPWKVGPELTANLLQDTLKKPVYLTKMPMPADAKTIYDLNADTIYRHMLQPSDNFMAEQLLLVCSSAKFNMLDADSVRRYAEKNLFNDLPDKIQWADGSGLSRMNLFTPRDLIMVLIKIRAEFKDEDFLHSLMPTGGIAGTIRSAYKTDNGKPFVWAKTGSLSNNHNQSGYLVTRKGHRLAFSFMNNNFTRPSREVRDEMVRIMTYIHENY